MLTSAGLLATLLAAAAAGPAGASRAQAYYHFTLAQQARLLDRTEEALQELRKARDADPGSGALRVELARVLREADQTTEALTEAREAARLDPGLAGAYRVIGQILEERHEAGGSSAELEAAVQAYETAARLDTEDQSLLRSLSGLYLQLKRPREAAATLEKYVEQAPWDREAVLRLVALHLEAGEKDKAATRLRALGGPEAGSPRVLQALGELYARTGDVDEAVRYYRQALALAPTDVMLRLQLGEVLVRARRHREALAEADQVLSVDPASRAALDLKARCLRDLTEYDQAARAAQEILRGDPDNLGALYLQVTIAEARHDYGAAVDVLQRLLGRNRRAESVEETRGRDRVFLVHLGFDLRQLGRFAESAETFARARDVVEPPEAELLGYHVDALVLAGERERALTEARAARGRFPEDAALATQEAHILRELGRPAEAERIVAGLLRRTTSDPETLREVAEFHQRGREFAEAEGLLRELARVRSGDARVLFMLGAVQERQKKHAEAEASFREALGRDPQFAPALNYLGYMFADRGEKLPEALDLLHRAIALDPENGAYLDSLGWALFRSNRAEEAEGYLRRAVAKERESAVVFDHLGDVLKVRGKLLEAVEYWTRALSARDEEQELDRAAVERKIKESGLGR